VPPEQDERHAEEEDGERGHRGGQRDDATAHAVMIPRQFRSKRKPTPRNVVM